MQEVTMRAGLCLSMLSALAVLLPACSGGSGDDDSGSGVAGAAGGMGGAGMGGAAAAAGSSMAASGGGGMGGDGGQNAVPCDVNGTAGVCIDVADCTGDYAPTPGFCPGPANIQCCTPLPAGQCDENTMPQPNAGLVEAPGAGNCPPGMIPIDTFCIDRVEASLVYVAGDAPFSPYFNPGSENVRAVAIEGAVPQGYISGAQAEDACILSGKRLCTDQEWLRACQGPTGWTFPYGDMIMAGVCNDARSVHPAVEYFGTTDPWIYSELGNPCLNQLADSVDATASHAGCVTPEGAFDMMGNLHEWTADPDGTFRGGFYVDTKLNGPGCLYATVLHDTAHWDYSTGFRCCADP
jgi:formylglycine-generating enzyme